MNKFSYEKRMIKNLLGDEMYNKLVKRNAILAGGAITSLFTRSAINDFDIYFRDEESLVSLMKHNWQIQAMTKKSILLRNYNQDVQFIFFNYFKNAEEIFQSFDFTINMGAFDFATEEFVLHEDFFYANTKKVLQFNPNTAFPLVSAMRLDKYISRGYVAPKLDSTAIALACMSLDIKTWGEFKEHIGGMYGENIDDAFDKADDAPFDIKEALTLMQDITFDTQELKEKYIEKMSNMDTSKEAILYRIMKRPINFLHWKNEFYGFNEKDELVITLGRASYVKDTDKIMSPSEFFKGKLVYKYVFRDGSGYKSIYDHSFKYELGKEVFADKDGFEKSKREVKSGVKLSSGQNLFFHTKGDILEGFYSDEKDAVIIECAVLPDEFTGIGDNGKLKFLRCIPLREITKEEILGLNNNSNPYGFSNVGNEEGEESTGASASAQCNGEATETEPDFF